MGDAAGDSELEKTVVSKETNQNQTGAFLTIQVGPRTCQRRARSVRKGARQELPEVRSETSHGTFFLVLPFTFAQTFVLYGYPSAYEPSPGTKIQRSAVSSREPVGSSRPPDWRDVLPGVVSPAAA